MGETPAQVPGSSAKVGGMSTQKIQISIQNWWWTAHPAA
ncbi:trp operon leader peptide, partial [Streptomyces sp. SID7982]|nr:trp operon leader peptide [Streptomyces sp. SID7982]